MSFWEVELIPVIGSSLALSCERVHEGVIRLSDEEEAEVTRRGISRAADMPMLDLPADG